MLVINCKIADFCGIWFYNSRGGGMPEWLKGTGCKPVGYAYVGSNPTPSTTLKALSNLLLRAPCASEPPIGGKSAAKSTR